MLRDVVLYGILGKKFGKVHKLSVNSFDEAIRALCCQYKGFRQAIKKDQHYALVLGKNLRTQKELREKGKCITEEEYKSRIQFNNDNTLHIVPIATGSKSKWIGSIIGVVLIIIGAILYYVYPANPVSGYLFKAGAALILGNIASVLSMPDTNGNRERPEERPSYTYNGATNTTEQGTIIPLVYGEMFVGSKVVSTRVDNYVI
jgi:predicted phage tail protein